MTTLRVLIADDNSAQRMFMKHMLSPYGECVLACDGQEAVDAFSESFENGERFNLVLMDIMMPIMDGHDAAQAIRKVEKDKNVLPGDEVFLFMTTALDDAENVWRSHFEDFATGYFVKPLRKEKLFNRLKELEILPPDA